MADGLPVVRFWRRSLQFRTVVSTVLVTVLVVGVAGIVLIQRVSEGLLDAAQNTALAEVSAGRSIARTFATTNPQPTPQDTVDALVEALADRAGKPPAYDVVLQPAPEAPDLPAQSTELVSADSLPPQLVDALRTRRTPAWVYADITYSDGRVEPGLILGTPVNIGDFGPYELYYLYGLDGVNRTISLGALHRHRSRTGARSRFGSTGLVVQPATRASRPASVPSRRGTRRR
ncbi:MAG: hypothetical protein V9E98_06925 [Candidatus Nanopelagicales bacterium]